MHAKASLLSFNMLEYLQEYYMHSNFFYPGYPLINLDAMITLKKKVNICELLLISNLRI